MNLSFPILFAPIQLQYNWRFPSIKQHCALQSLSFTHSSNLLDGIYLYFTRINEYHDTTRGLRGN